MYTIVSRETKNQEALLIKFKEFLPSKPYCSNDLTYGLKIRPKDKAIEEAYIQYNPIERAYWLVFDIDTDKESLWGQGGTKSLPTPNMSVENLLNYRRHEFYLIDPAVYTLRQAREKPLKLAADIDKGLTILLNADPGFSKLITKNPLIHYWETKIWHEKAYGLLELLEYIPEKIKKQRIEPRNEVGLGRNCTVFEKIRYYAYGEWRRLGFKDYERLFEQVFDMALNINSEFLLPMQRQEVKSICRSVCKWTARHMTAGEFSQIQRDRGIKGNIKSQVVRSTKSKDRADEAKALYTSGKTQAQIALMMGLSRVQVNRLLQEKKKDNIL